MKLVAVRSIVERELMSLMKQQQQQQPDEERQAVATTSVDPSVNHPNMLIGNIERELRADGYHLAQASQFNGNRGISERQELSPWLR